MQDLYRFILRPNQDHVELKAFSLDCSHALTLALHKASNLQSTFCSLKSEASLLLAEIKGGNKSTTTLHPVFSKMVSTCYVNQPSSSCSVALTF